MESIQADEEYLSNVSFWAVCFYMKVTVERGIKVQIWFHIMLWFDGLSQRDEGAHPQRQYVTMVVKTFVRPQLHW